MTDLTEAIAECLAVHAEALEVVGTAEPELDPRIPSELKEKVVRQRQKVDRTLSGDPAVHQRQVESLTCGVRVCLARLVKPAPKPSKPPAPKWDDQAKRWIQP